jgi:hypothetical protein
MIILRVMREDWRLTLALSLFLASATFLMTAGQT